MNLSDREKVFRYTFEEIILPLGRKKGHDYSGSEDSLSNLRDFGWQGVIVRIGDKYHRLKNFILQGVTHVQNEKIEDTIIDLIVYGFLCYILFKEDELMKSVGIEMTMEKALRNLAKTVSDLESKT